MGRYLASTSAHPAAWLVVPVPPCSTFPINDVVAACSRPVSRLVYAGVLQLGAASSKHHHLLHSTSLPPHPPSSSPSDPLQQATFTLGSALVIAVAIRPPPAMALPSLRSLAIAAVALLPALASAQANSSYTEADMMRAHYELLNNRPKDCPPWYALSIYLSCPASCSSILIVLSSQLQLSSPSPPLHPVFRLQ